MASAKFNYTNPLYTPNPLEVNNNPFSNNQTKEELSKYKIMKEKYGIDELARQDTMNLLNYQMKYNEYMTDKANQFTNEQSSSQYQRAVEDMKKAGINPMIAFSGGASGLSNSVGTGALGQSPTVSASQNSDSLLSKSTAKNINTFFNNLTKGKDDGDVTNILKLASILF